MKDPRMNFSVTVRVEMRLKLTVELTDLTGELTQERRR